MPPKKDLRGLRTEHHDTQDLTKPLDSLAKIFCMGEYTGVLRTQQTGRWYIAFPGDRGFSLNSNQVNGLLQAVDSLVNANAANLDEIKSAKVTLFSKMIENNNKLIETKYQELRKGGVNGTITQSVLNDWSKMCDPTSRRETSTKIGGDSLKQLIASFIEDNLPIFDTILTPDDIANIKIAGTRLLLDHNRLPIEILKSSGIYTNVHVEIGAIHYALSKDSNNREFDLGLAHGMGKTVGCCNGCNTDLTKLEQYGVIVQRTADFPDNPPRAGYKPFWDLPGVHGLSNKPNKDVSHGDVVKDSWDTELTTRVDSRPLGYEKKDPPIKENTAGTPKGIGSTVINIDENPTVPQAGIKPKKEKAWDESSSEDEVGKMPPQNLNVALTLENIVTTENPRHNPSAQLQASSVARNSRSASLSDEEEVKKPLVGKVEAGASPSMAPNVINVENSPIRPQTTTFQDKSTTNEPQSASSVAGQLQPQDAAVSQGIGAAQISVSQSVKDQAKAIGSQAIESKPGRKANKGGGKNKERDKKTTTFHTP